MFQILFLTLSTFLFLPTHTADPQQPSVEEIAQSLLNGEPIAYELPEDLSCRQVITLHPDSEITKKQGPKRFILDELVERYVALYKKEKFNEDSKNMSQVLYTRAVALYYLNYEEGIYFNPTQKQLDLSAKYDLIPEENIENNMLTNLLKKNPINNVIEKIKEMPPHLFPRAEEKDKHKVLLPLPIKIDEESTFENVDGTTFKLKATVETHARLLDLAVLYHMQTLISVISGKGSLFTLGKQWELLIPMQITISLRVDTH